MNRQTIKIRKRQKKLKEKHNKDLRRQFVNVKCSGCGRLRHIRVNDKSAWKDVDKKKYVCVLCK